MQPQDASAVLEAPRGVADQHGLGVGYKASVPTKRRRSGGLVPLDTTVLAFPYRRVSSKDQSRKGISLPTQAAETRAYISSKAEFRWLLGDEFEDIQTGRRSDRDGYQRMLSAIR